MLVVDTAFERGHYPLEVFRYQYHMTHLGLTKARAKHVVRKLQQDRIYRSKTHQVAVNPFASQDPQPNPLGQGLWLSIKRIDRSPLDRREELADILRAVAPGYAGFELFPAPARLVDTANQYHVWAYERSVLRDLVDTALGPCFDDGGTATQHLLTPQGQEQALVVIDSNGIQDWRALYEYKEARFPGCEAVMYFDSGLQHQLHGKLLILTDATLRMPFGFERSLVSDTDVAAQLGATQRSLTSYRSMPMTALSR